MSPFEKVISPHQVLLPKAALREMVRVMRTLFVLGRLPAYRERVLPLVPEIARFDPGHDAVMMGYDFHLTEDGPRLIEVNTNAGGGLLAYQAQNGAGRFGGFARDRFRRRFLSSFREELARQGRRSRLTRVVIIDEKPEEQFLYPEMIAYANLLSEEGIDTAVVEPGDLRADACGLWLHGEQVDLIYNRHCDFYLESDVMVSIRAAYLAGAVCLTPNPFAYGLLADKRRMILWSDPEALVALGLKPRAIDLLSRMVPKSRLLADIDPGQAWEDRKDLVFKPVTRFGSRGVLVGRKISRKRFEEQPPDETLVQQLVSPSQITIEDDDQEMKVDFRLFSYRDRLLAVGARLYQGQVTNLRTPGGGYAPVRIV